MGTMNLRRAMERLIPEPEVRRYLAAFALVFAVSVPAGALLRVPVLSDLAKSFAEMKADVGEMPGGTVFLLILLNSLFSSLLLLLTGLLAGVVPALSVAANGLFMGLIYRHVASTAGQGQAALFLLPHGLFEVPALLVIASYGLWLGVGAVRRFRGREPRTIPDMLNLALRRYFTVVLPLLIAASAAETVRFLR